jgi:RHS repeat-associated protein
VNLTYDNAGNLTGYSDGTSSATYAYDDLYRKIGETVNYGAFSLSTAYTYHKNGTKKSFTYPNGTAVDYSYDPNNQPAGITIPSVGTIVYDSYQWTRPTSMTLPGSGKQQFSYDPLMRTKTITASDPAQNPQMSYSYSYDKMDNIKMKGTEAGNYAYGYDDLYRLNDVKKDTIQTEAYTYDPVGNRLTSMVASNWTYNQNNELQSYNSTTYQYDANGNTIQKNAGGPVHNYVYDGDNRLVEVKDGSGGTIATYTYDPFGRRIKKDVGGVITYYLYSDEGLIGEYTAVGAEIKIYGYKPDSTWTTDPLFCHSHESGNPEYYFYHNDHLGTPMKMTNASGVVVWSATYDAFGKATVDVGATVANNLRFPGQYWDEETGLHYNFHRYYDSNMGRYASEDPIGLSGGDNNLFVYVWNKPIRGYDPWGLFGEDVHSGVGNSKYGTYLWAIQVGFSDAQAKKISIGNDGTDGGFAAWYPWWWATGDQSRHFNQNSFFENKMDSRIKWAEIELQRAIDYYTKGDCNAALGHLGKGLHSLQDLFAHRDWDTGWHGADPHPAWYDDWNDPRNALVRQQAEIHSKSYVIIYLLRTGQL